MVQPGLFLDNVDNKEWTMIPTYCTNIFLVELWSNDCCFDKIPDLGFSREAAQRRRQGLFDVPVTVASHFDLEPGEVYICEHTVRAACIVERELSNCQLGGSRQVE